MFTHLNRDYEQQEELGVLIGIDPGSETLGVSVLQFNRQGIVQIQAATYKGSRLPLAEDTELVHGARHARIQAHYANLFGLFLQYQPLGVASESPFFQATRPQAYGALTEVVSMIRAALLTYRPNLSLALIDPPTVKRAVGAKGNAGKEDVKSAIISHQDINRHYCGAVPLWQLDEHSLDAIAVVYGYFQALRGEGL